MLFRSAEDPGKTPADTGVATSVVMDGKVIDAKLAECGVTERQIRHIIEKAGVKQEDVFLLTVNKLGQVNLIERDESI